MPGDQIILIGFSRGAFTARALASFIEDVGILTKIGAHRHLRRIYSQWLKKLVSKDAQAEFEYLLGQVESPREKVNITACAVWDTVASLGPPLPKWFPQTVFNKLASRSATLRGTIEHAFQALALDERRWHFKPILWDSSHQTLKQCWFLGSHSDVGGGYEKPGLANISLAWMILQLSQFIHFDVQSILEHIRAAELIDYGGKPLPDGAVQGHRIFAHKSMRFFYRLGGVEARKPGHLFSGGGAGQTIHFTVGVFTEPGMVQKAQTCKALKKRYEKNPDGHFWSYKEKKKRDKFMNPIEEEMPSTFEAALLHHWIDQGFKGSDRKGGKRDKMGPGFDEKLDKLLVEKGYDYRGDKLKAFLEHALKNHTRADNLYDSEVG